MVLAGTPFTGPNFCCFDLEMSLYRIIRSWLVTKHQWWLQWWFQWQQCLITWGLGSSECVTHIISRWDHLFSTCTRKVLTRRLQLAMNYYCICPLLNVTFSFLRKFFRKFLLTMQPDTKPKLCLQHSQELAWPASSPLPSQDGDQLRISSSCSLTLMTHRF